MIETNTIPQCDIRHSGQLADAALPRMVMTGESGASRAMVDPLTASELTIIAQQTAGDLGLKVTIGEPGKGSFFSHEPLLITLDPLHIVRNPMEAKFVAGHEGAHRRFSPSPYEMGFSRFEIEAQFGELGFHSTMNTIEDCAVNDGMSRELVGLGHCTTAVYEEADQKGLGIRTPEIETIIQRIGREPKFAVALAEITRDWHRWRKEVGYEGRFENVAREGRYGENLDPAVVSVLLQTRRAARVAISQMPPVHELLRGTIVEFGRRRFEIVRDEIFPAIQRLVREDVAIEALRQWNELSGNDAADDDADGQPNQSQNSQGQLSQQAKRDIQRAIEQNLREQAAAQAAEYEELAKELESERAKGNADPADEAAKARTEALKARMNEMLPHPPCDERTAASGAATDELMQAMAEGIEAQMKQGKPLPFEKLSPATQQELQQAFDALPESTQADLKERAEAALAELEHEIVQALAPKLETNPVQTTHAQSESQDLADEQYLANEERMQAMQDVAQQLEDARQADLTPFDRVRERIAPDIDAAVNRLQRILIPQASFRWRRDRQTGTRLNLQRAQQAEADPRYLTKLFEQRLDPTRRTHAIEVLVDTSESMKGQKIAATFEGVVFTSCVLENLFVDFEVIEFNDQITVHKAWEDSLKSEDTRRAMGRLETASDKGTLDAPAIEEANHRLAERPTQYKFIVVLTDAGSGVSSSLRRVLQKIDKAGKVVVIHFGIGSGTKDAYGYYRFSFGDLSPSEFFRTLCEVIEDIVLHPEKYRRPSRQNQEAEVEE